MPRKSNFLTMPSWFLKGFYLRYQGLNGCSSFIPLFITTLLSPQYYRVGHPFFSKERNVLALFSFLYKRMRRSLRSFLFFIKECGIFCILFHSLQNNGTFFAFFYVLNKRKWRSLRSFTFFIKERKRTQGSFWFHIYI